MLLLAKTENIACIRKKNVCELNYWSFLSKNRWDLYKINFNRSRVSMLSSSSVFVCGLSSFGVCCLLLIDWVYRNTWRRLGCVIIGIWIICVNIKLSNSNYTISKLVCVIRAYNRIFWFLWCGFCVVPSFGDWLLMVFVLADKRGRF